MAAAKASFPGGAFAQGAGPEVKGTRLGYIALYVADKASLRSLVWMVGHGLIVALFVLALRA
mgnify:CR=1 FL=1